MRGEAYLHHFAFSCGPARTGAGSINHLPEAPSVSAPSAALRGRSLGRLLPLGPGTVSRLARARARARARAVFSAKNPVQIFSNLAARLLKSKKPAAHDERAAADPSKVSTTQICPERTVSRSGASRRDTGSAVPPTARTRQRRTITCPAPIVKRSILMGGITLTCLGQMLASTHKALVRVKAFGGAWPSSSASVASTVRRFAAHATCSIAHTSHRLEDGKHILA